MAIKYIVRLDDIAPTMNEDNFVRLVDCFKKYNIQPILGVIPDNQDKELLAFRKVSLDFWQEMKELQSQFGFAIALHGYQHVYVTKESGLLRINKRSEFAGLSLEEQTDKIKKGVMIFKEKGLVADAFMAPSHSFDENTLKALKANSINYVTDGYGIFPYSYNEMTFVPQLFAKPIGFVAGIYTICLHINSMTDRQVDEFCGFIRANYKEVVSFNDIKVKTYNGCIYKIMNRMIRLFIIIMRTLRKR